MNVYFCDVCGVRVTDVDLHAGHGMRRRNDVICAACIDLGHGKEWVEAHAHKQAPALAGAVAGGANGHAAAPPRPVEMARDRLQTLDEDEPASPVRPVQLPAAPEFDDTAQVPVVSQELASAAAGFAALTPPKAEKSATDEDDIEELPPPRLDDSGASARLEDGKPDDSGASPKVDESGPAPVVAASPFDTGVKIEDRADDEHGGGEKSETSVSESSIDESDRPEPKKGPSTRKATSSSRVSKAGKSSRAKRGPKKNSQQQFMLISIASMALIIIIGAIVISSSKGGSHSGGEKIPVNVSGAVHEAVAKTKSAQKIAVGSRDMAKLQAAHAACVDVHSAVSSYERVAKEKGFSEDQIESFVSGSGVQDVYSVDTAVRHEIVLVQELQQSGH